MYKLTARFFPICTKKKGSLSSRIGFLANEHVSCTAITGLGGRGIIDIDISVPKQVMKHVSNILQKLGYEFRPTFSISDRFYFVFYLADPEEGSRCYHIYLIYPSSKEWKKLIGFRNGVRTNPEAVEEYATIKKEAAKMANQDEKK